MGGLPILLGGVKMSDMCNLSPEFFSIKHQAIIDYQSMINDILNSSDYTPVNSNEWASYLSSLSWGSSDYIKQFLKIIIGLDRLEKLIINKRIEESSVGHFSAVLEAF